MHLKLPTMLKAQDILKVKVAQGIAKETLEVLETVANKHGPKSCIIDKVY